MTRRLATMAFLAPISEALATVAWVVLGRLPSWQAMSPVMQWSRWIYSCGVIVVVGWWVHSAALGVPADERGQGGSDVAAATVEGFFVPVASLWLEHRTV